jgi:hypothetical protein
LSAFGDTGAGRSASADTGAPKLFDRVESRWADRQVANLEIAALRFAPASGKNMALP